MPLSKTRNEQLQRILATEAPAGGNPAIDQQLDAIDLQLDTLLVALEHADPNNEHKKSQLNELIVKASAIKSALEAARTESAKKDASTE
jgi:hypothetical protein